MDRYWSKVWEIFMNCKKTSAGLSVMTVADLFQLPPVRAKLLFSQFSDWGSMKHETLLTCLINLELVTLMMILKSYSLKGRFIHDSDKNCSKDALYTYTVNENAMDRNDAVLNDVPLVLHNTGSWKNSR